MPSFDTFNFEADEGWKNYLHNVTIPAGEDEDRVVDRLKKRYYKRNIDPTYEETPSTSPPPSSNTSSSSPNVPLRSNSGTTPSSTSPPPPQSPASHSFLSLQNIWLMAHASVLLNSVLYLLPFFSRDSSTYYYRTALMAGVVVYFSVLLQLFGAGYYTPSSATRAKESLYYLLYSACFLLVPPSLVTLIPLLVYSYYQISDQIYGTLSRIPLLGRLVSKAKAYSQQALFIAAYIEVMNGGMILLQSIGGSISLLSLLVYWQFLTYRFNSSQHTKTILETLSGRLEGLVTHRWCPSVIQTFYRKASHFFHLFASFDRTRP